MPTYGGLFNNQWDDDFGAIASRAAEQLANTRSASQNEQTQAAEDLAKRPQPTRSVKIDENPDGTITHTTTVKNAPPRNPATQIKEAGNAPYAAYAQRVLEEGAALGNSMLDDTDKLSANIDQQLSTREGRAELAKKELGIENPRDVPGEFLRSGIFNFRAKTKAYEDYISDPAKLKRAILAKRFAEAEKVGTSLRSFNQDLTDVDRENRLRSAEERQVSAEQRREHSAEMSQFNTAIDNIRAFDLSASMKNADEAVNYWKQGYGPVWDQWGSRLEPIIRSEYDRRKLERDKADAAQRAKDAKDAHERSLWDEREKMLDLQIKNLQSTIDARDHKANTLSLSRKEALETPVAELIGYVGDEGYDQKSVERALATKEHNLVDERRKIEAKKRMDNSVYVSLTRDPDSAILNQQKIATLKAHIAGYKQRQAEIDADLATLRNRKGAKKSEKAAPPPAENASAPTGPILSRDEALRRLNAH